MKKPRFTDSQIIAVPERIAGGALVPKLCRRHGARIEHMQPRNPRQNADIGRDNRTVGYA